MTKLENKKQQKKEALFSTAFELFTSKGFSKTSIADIVDNAGVAKGTFYLYFKDKYDIRNKLIAHKAAEVCKKAHTALIEKNITDYEERILFLQIILLISCVIINFYCVLFPRI